MNRSLVTTFLILSTWSWAIGVQSSGLPNSIVKKTFRRMYPASTEVDWKEHEEGNVVAYFEMEDGSKEAYFDTKGNWLRTVTYIMSKDLPKGVIRYVNEHFEKTSVYDARKYQDPDTQLEYKVILTMEGWLNDDGQEEETEVMSNELLDWMTFIVLSFSEGGNFLSAEKFQDY